MRVELNAYRRLRRIALLSISFVSICVSGCSTETKTNKQSISPDGTFTMVLTRTDSYGPGQNSGDTEIRIRRLQGGKYLTVAVFDDDNVHHARVYADWTGRHNLRICYGAVNLVFEAIKLGDIQISYDSC